MRYRRYKSRSRLEARDIEGTNLDLVSNNEIIKISISSRKKTKLSFIFFCWNLLCNNFEASVLFLPPPYGIYVVHSHFPNTITLLSLSLDFWRPCSHHNTMSWEKLHKSESWIEYILQLNCPQSTIAFHGGFVCTYQHWWDRYFDNFLIQSMYLLNKKDTILISHKR